jgi:hypothetical protein
MHRGRGGAWTWPGAHVGQKHVFFVSSPSQVGRFILVAETLLVDARPISERQNSSTRTAQWNFWSVWVGWASRPVVSCSECLVTSIRALLAYLGSTPSRFITKPSTLVSNSWKSLQNAILGFTESIHFFIAGGRPFTSQDQLSFQPNTSWIQNLRV